jgi:GTP cyclohydrolase II
MTPPIAPIVETNVGTSYLQTDRAAAELRRGGTVLLRLANGESCLFKAAELGGDDGEDTLSAVTGSGVMLALTDNRIASLGRQLQDKHTCATMPVSGINYTSLFDLAAGQPRDDILGKDISLIGERPDSLADMATRLLRIAKLVPAALMSRFPSRDKNQQDRLACSLNILTIDAKDIEQSARQAAQSLKIAARAKVPLAVAPDAEVVMFRANLGGDEHFAVVVGDGLSMPAPLVRLHSQCVTGDVLGSLKCDCGNQLQGALALMADAGGGVLVYLAQEGRDIGLLNKMRAYALQDEGLDTVDANHALGFDTDERLFLPACRILQELGLTKLRLITNNPDKIAQLDEVGLEVIERVPLNLPENQHNKRYLATKRERTGHLSD